MKSMKLAERKAIKISFTSDLLTHILHILQHNNSFNLQKPGNKKNVPEKTGF